MPTKPDEYAELGSYAMIGLPNDQYPTGFITPGGKTTPYQIMIAGRNFGCGSSREHAPIALGAAGVQAVVAETYARIFFRNSVATGEVFPYESVDRLCEILKTGDEGDAGLFQRHADPTRARCTRSSRWARCARWWKRAAIFAYARQSGMIPAATAV